MHAAWSLQSFNVGMYPARADHGHMIRGDGAACANCILKATARLHQIDNSCINSSVRQGLHAESSKMKVFLLSLLLLLPLLATGAHVEFSSKYPFQKVLFDGQGQFYGLYWNYSITAGTIHFAVNVSTTGWVGFGVSPNGQMPGSDVVIGWVAADGKSYFHVIF